MQVVISFLALNKGYYIYSLFSEGKYNFFFLFIPRWYRRFKIPKVRDYSHSSSLHGFYFFVPEFLRPLNGIQCCMKRIVGEGTPETIGDRVAEIGIYKPFYKGNAYSTPKHSDL